MHVWNDRLFRSVATNFFLPVLVLDLFINNIGLFAVQRFYHIFFSQHLSIAIWVRPLLASRTKRPLYGPLRGCVVSDLIQIIEKIPFYA